MVHAALAQYERRYGILPAAEAAEIVLAHTPVLGAEPIATVESFGRTLAETVRSPEQMPPFPASTVDGYAVVAGDTSEWRELLEDVLAGAPIDSQIAPGRA